MVLSGVFSKISVHEDAIWFGVILFVVQSRDLQCGVM